MIELHEMPYIIILYELTYLIFMIQILLNCRLLENRLNDGMVLADS